ncbi:hypothetical protein DPMN_087105 [Dreissena polymorpha]|uniref:Uncharacterized protein n=1 Tax=Dreissena polymorpha TaxID=45954 RepID=A0A9D4KTJ7_DREPO|nr:hypothetical protein DPMN_087105 [Dreissena polymorpha]
MRGLSGKHIERKRSYAMAASIKDDVLFIAAVRNLENLHTTGWSNVQNCEINAISIGRLMQQFIKSLIARVMMKYAAVLRFILVAYTMSAIKFPGIPKTIKTTTNTSDGTSI